MGDLGAEVLDDHLGLLRQLVRVQGDELGDRRLGLAGVELGVVGDRLLDVPVRLVGDVVGEHVEDEALLDRLAHRVQVERHMPPGRRVVAAEQLQRACLRRGGEGEERQVRLLAPGGRRSGQRILGLVDRLVGVRLLADAEHRLHRGGRVAGLRGVRLVDDHGVPALRQRLDLVGDERELLQRRDDDPGLLTGEGVGELLAVLVDPHHDAVGVLELVDRVLQLPVEHPAVGDHHDLVEHLVVVGVVQRRQPVGHPGDRVRLARPGRVLHEVVPPGTVLTSIGRQRPHGVPLVIPGEDHHRPGLRSLRRRLDVHEPLQQIEPGVPLPHLLPQVRRAMTVRVRRVPGTHLVATVERQEPGQVARQPGRHRHGLGVDGEVHDRPTQQRVLRITVRAVLRPGVLDGLAGDRVLQLGRRHRDPVHEQAQVERLRRVRLVRQLPGHRQPVLLVPLDQLRRQPRGGLEVRQPERHAEILDAVPYHIDRAPSIDLLGEPPHEPTLRLPGVVAVAGEQRVPRRALRRPDEGEQLRRVDRRLQSKSDDCRSDLDHGVATVLHEP